MRTKLSEPQGLLLHTLTSSFQTLASFKTTVQLCNIIYRLKETEKHNMPPLMHQCSITDYLLSVLIKLAIVFLSSSGFKVSFTIYHILLLLLIILFYHMIIYVAIIYNKRALKGNLVYIVKLR